MVITGRLATADRSRVSICGWLCKNIFLASRLIIVQNLVEQLSTHLCHVRSSKNLGTLVPRPWDEAAMTPCFSPTCPTNCANFSYYIQLIQAWLWRYTEQIWRLQAHSRSLEQIRIDRATYDILTVFHSSHGYISYRFRDKRPFLSQIK